MENDSDSPRRRGCKSVLEKLGFFGRASSGRGRGSLEFPLALLDHEEDFSRKKTLARVSGADQILRRGPDCFFDFDAHRGAGRRFSLGDLFAGGGYPVGSDPAGFPDFVKRRQTGVSIAGARCFAPGMQNAFSETNKERIGDSWDTLHSLGFPIFP